MMTIDGPYTPAHLCADAKRLRLSSADLARIARVHPDTARIWLRGERLPQDLEGLRQAIREERDRLRLAIDEVAA